MTSPVFLTPEQELEIRRAFQPTPSAMSPWFGAWRDGDPMTAQQYEGLAKLGMDPTATDRLIVQVKVSSREWWWPTTQSAPVRRITCPVVGRRQDRVKVLAPSGAGKLVYPNGQLTRPRAKRWSTTNREK